MHTARDVSRRAIGFAVGGFALAVLLAGCNTGPAAGPAPVVMKGPNDAGWQGPPPSELCPPPRMASIVPQPLAADADARRAGAADGRASAPPGIA